MSDWCILRCRGASTLRLAKALEHEGFEAWTPVEVQTRRKRNAGARTEVMVAVMPTYVFARAENLPELCNLANAEDRTGPDFSVFRYNERFPVIADRELSSLRHIERKAAAKREPVRFEQGQSVRMGEGPFQGLTGQVVETSKGQFTLVAFPGFAIPIKFASWKLDRAA